VSHLGFFCIPSIGHLNPAIALGRSLLTRGHTVTFFHASTLSKQLIQDAGLGFRLIEERNLQHHAPYNSGWKKHRAGGLRTAETLELIARITLQGSPEAVRSANVDAVLVDQADFAAGSVAQALNLPFVNVSFFPPIYLDDEVPPAYFGWSHRSGGVARIRNRFGNAVVEKRLFARALALVNERRRAWNLPEFHHANQAFSKLAIITQLPAPLDFPRRNRPAHLYHTGPFQDSQGRRPVEFPWERLTGKPLIFASMGTIRNDLRSTFRTIAEACAAFDLQLVLSLGGRLGPAEVGPLPGDPVLVHYAPQLEVLKRACLTITHGGLNTTLESLAEGIPLVAIPVTDDQPGVAARIEWARLGAVVPFQKLSVERLREAIQTVLKDPGYRAAAQLMKVELQRIDGLKCATDLIERVLNIRACNS
jgi:MGT family glycosyltransferase